MKKPKLSLILPCYNESAYLEDSVSKIIKVLKSINYSWEIIFVEDKSSDNTREIIFKIIKQYAKLPLRAIFHRKNYGRGKAVMTGIRSSRAEIVGYIDVDLEVSPQYIPSFIEKIDQGVDAVCGVRLYNFSINSLPRFLASKVYRLIFQTLFRCNLYDTETGYKFFRRSKLNLFMDKLKNNHWFWDTEVMVYSYLYKLSIEQPNIKFLRRTDKKSTVRLLPDTLDYLKEIVLFRREIGKRFSISVKG